ncbi:hypothetical protein RRF57_002371 [Xylaria bambusicola]|uniref:Uncharacterized protein n=1 Tax=Xylaria bambusicola TaxID=326684 RepID=A0AAN7UIM9_9PEZI
MLDELFAHIELCLVQRDHNLQLLDDILYLLLEIAFGIHRPRQGDYGLVLFLLSIDPPHAINPVPKTPSL